MLGRGHRQFEADAAAPPSVSNRTSCLPSPLHFALLLLDPKRHGKLGPRRHRCGSSSDQHQLPLTLELKCRRCRSELSASLLCAVMQAIQPRYRKLRSRACRNGQPMVAGESEVSEVIGGQAWATCKFSGQTLSGAVITKMLAARARSSVG